LGVEKIKKICYNKYTTRNLTKEQEMSETKERPLQFVPALMLAGVSGEVRTEKGLAYLQVYMDEGIAMMEEETDYILLDVRRPNEFYEGHIPGAINVPNEEIGEKELPLLPKDQRIFVYCRSGRRSKQACLKLSEMGYTDLVEFGGILDYDGPLEY
jgi:rhodanese-related sulfurtransferase